MLNVSAQKEHRRGPEEEGVGKRNFSTDHVSKARAGAEKMAWW